MKGVYTELHLDYAAFPLIHLLSILRHFYLLGHVNWHDMSQNAINTPSLSRSWQNLPWSSAVHFRYFATFDPDLLIVVPAERVASYRSKQLS